MSFPSREEGIAVELCEGLVKVCKQKGVENFEFHPRYSKESKERWDGGFIDRALDTNHIGKDHLKRVWVCGPPAMNEQFDRHLLALPSKSFHYEIL